MATAPVNVNANLNFNPQSLNAASRQVQSAFGNINIPTKPLAAFNNSLGRITGQASEFDKSINAATARVFAFGAAVTIINGISSSFKSLVSATIEVEKRITEIGAVLQTTSSQLNEFKNEIFDVAKNTGQAFSTVADAAQELARQGLSAEETAKRLNASLILTRISGLDAEDSVKALTSAINGFASAGLSAEQIVNKLVAVDTAFAVSAKDLADGFSRAGSTAEDAGVSFDELLGLITSVQQTTARGGAVIGNAFKSIFARLSRGTVIEDLKALGVEIDQSQTGVQKLQALATALQGISDPTQANAIKELAGGVFQINVVSAALKDLSNESSIFAQASRTAGEASNEAFQKNAELNKTLAAQFNSLIQGLTELGSKIGDLSIAPVIEKLLTGANQLIEILNKVFDPEQGNKFIQGFFKGIGNFLAGPGLILISAAFFKLFQLVAKFAKEGISDLFKIGTEQEKIKNIEAGIVSLLQKDANLRQVLASATATQAQKEQAVINAIKQENILLTQQQQILNSIASAARTAGVGGFTPSGGFSKRSGKGKFAAGFMEEEAMAKALGASSSVKAKYGKGTIDGQKFIMNNQEVEIPNFGGGKDSAVIPTYASGFVPNFNKRPRPVKVSYNQPLTKNEIEEFGIKKDEIDSFNKKINSLSGKSWTSLDNITKNSKNQTDIAAAKILLARRGKQKEQNLEQAFVGSALKPLDIMAPEFGYLIPEFKRSQEIDPTQKYNTKDKWKGKVVHFNLLNTPLRGPFPEKIIESENKDEDIADSVMNKIISETVKYADKIGDPIFQTPNLSAIKKGLGEGGNRGAYGAVLGAAGAAFEAAMVAGLGIDNANVPKLGEADFDVENVSPSLEKLFNISNISRADFKVKDSETGISSFGRKILNTGKYNNVLKDYLNLPDENEKETSKRPRKKNRTRASGFIPNFNSLNKGVPISQIRAHFDEFGNPIAVTNKRDEPNGLKDAIKREKRGESMFAGGFIPNFAVPKKVKLKSRNAGQATGVPEESGGVFGKSAVTGLAISSLISVGINPLTESLKISSEQIQKEIDKRDELNSKLDEEKQKEKQDPSVIKDLEKQIESLNKSVSTMESTNASIEKTVGTIAGVANIASTLSGFIDFKKSFTKIGPALSRGAPSLGLAAAGGAGGAGGAAAGTGLLGVGAGTVVGLGAAALAVGVGIGEAIKFVVGSEIEKAEQKANAPFQKAREMSGVGFRAERFAQKQKELADLQRQRQELDQQRVDIKNSVNRTVVNPYAEREIFDKTNILGTEGIVDFTKEVNSLSQGMDDISKMQMSRKPQTLQGEIRTARMFSDKQFERQKEERSLEFRSKQVSSSLESGKILEQLIPKKVDIPTNVTDDVLKGLEKQLSEESQKFQDTEKVSKLGSEIQKLYGDLAKIPYGIRDPKFNEEVALKQKQIEVKTEQQRKESVKPLLAESDEKRIADLQKQIEARKSVETRKQAESRKTGLMQDVTKSFGNLLNIDFNKFKNSDGNFTSQSINDFSAAQKDALKDLDSKVASLEAALGETATEDQKKTNAEFIQKYKENAQQLAKDQSDAFRQASIADFQNRQNILRQEQELLNKFIDDFNASFGQNLDSVISSLDNLRNATPIAQARDFSIGKIGQGSITRKPGSATLGGGTLGQRSDIFASRLNTVKQFESQFSQSQLSGLLDPVQQAKFRSNLAGQTLGGGSVSAIQQDLITPAAQQLIGKDGVLSQVSKTANAGALNQGAGLQLENLIKGLKGLAGQTKDNSLLQKISELEKLRGGSASDIVSGISGLDLDKFKSLGESGQLSGQQLQIEALSGITGLGKMLNGEALLNEQQKLTQSNQELTKAIQSLSDFLKERGLSPLDEKGNVKSPSIEVVESEEANKEQIAAIKQKAKELDDAIIIATQSVRSSKDAYIEASKAYSALVQNITNNPIPSGKPGSTGEPDPNTQPR